MAVAGVERAGAWAANRGGYLAAFRVWGRSRVTYLPEIRLAPGRAVPSRHKYRWQTWRRAGMPARLPNTGCVHISGLRAGEKPSRNHASMLPQISGSTSATSPTTSVSLIRPPPKHHRFQPGTRRRQRATRSSAYCAIPATAQVHRSALAHPAAIFRH